MANNSAYLNNLEKVTNVVGDVSSSSVIQATGYIARGYSKIVLDSNTAGGIQDILAAISLLSTPRVGAVGLGDIDYIKLVGLVARVVEKITLEQNFSAAVQDIILIVQTLGAIK